MSQHKRNIEGMMKAIHNKRSAVIARVYQTITQMEDENQPITFKGVASKAKVSKAWLYREAAVREKINELRAHQLSFQPLAQQNSTRTNASIISALKKRIKTLDSENQELRKQLEILYGKLHLQK